MIKKITDYIDVRKKMTDLGCRYPERMALLPINFESASTIGDFLQASETSTIKKLLLSETVPIEDIVERSQRPPYVKNKSHEWVAPIIFVSASLWSQYEPLVAVALNVLGNYATEFLRGSSSTHEVNLKIVVEKKNKTYKQIEYEGSIEGLRDLPKVIREIADE